MLFCATVVFVGFCCVSQFIALCRGLQPWKLLQNAGDVDVSALKAIFQDEQLDCFATSEFTLDIDELNRFEAEEESGACAESSRPRKVARRTEDNLSCWTREC